MKRVSIPSGSIMRRPAVERKYSAQTKKEPGVCVFCEYRNTPEKVMRHYSSFMLVRNIFSYEIWDGCHVVEHLLLTPNRHIESLSDLTPAESTEYVQIISSFEENGYAVYARPAGSAGKSIPHQHTHFIKIDNKRIKSQIYLYQPHVNLVH